MGKGWWRRRQSVTKNAKFKDHKFENFLDQKQKGRHMPDCQMLQETKSSL